MAREPRPDASAPVGATLIGGKKKSGRGRLIGLILGAIVAIALLALLLSRCGSGSGDSTSTASSGTANGSSSTTTDSSTSSTSSSASSTTATTTAAPAAPAAGATGTIVAADGQSLVDLAGSADPATALAAVSGQAITGTAVQVLSVPADEDFWVGTSDTARVWVQLTGSGESAY